MAYVDPDGFDQWAFAGDKIDVHAEHVERFDSLNVLPGDEPDEASHEVQDEAPAGNASLEAWQEYARSKDVDTEGLSRNEIRALFA